MGAKVNEELSMVMNLTHIVPVCHYLWGCSIGTDSVTNSTTLGSVAKSGNQGRKSGKKRTKMLGQLHLPDVA